MPKNGLMRVLVCTHHLYAWRGSELVAIELVEALRDAGADVSLLCQHFESDFIAEALGADTVITQNPEDIDPYAFNLIYSQHQMASHLIPALLAKPDGMTGCGPVIVHNHLSPFEPYEAPGPYFERHMSDLVWANSPETKTRLHTLAPWLSVDVVPNPAPSVFARASATGTPPSLRRLLAVSNHLPDVVSATLDALETQGVAVTRLGQGHTARRVTPLDFDGHDAILTIGKSVQYAVRARIPVYCFDHFGGPGWLNETTFQSALAMNFSGRNPPDASLSLPPDAAALAHDMMAGFDTAWAFSQTIDDAPFAWDGYVQTLLELAQAPPTDARAARWAALHTDPERRSEFALEYEKTLLFSRIYQGRQAQALKAREKRLEQAATIKALRVQLKKLKARLTQSSP